MGVGLTSEKLLYFTMNERLMYVEDLKDWAGGSEGTNRSYIPTVSLRGCLTAVKILESNLNPLVD